MSIFQYLSVLLIACSLLFFHAFGFEIFNDIIHSLNLSQLFCRDLDVIFFFQSHRQFE